MSDEQFLYLTSAGHQSGNPHEVEIWFVSHDDHHYIVAEHRERAHWVQNIRANPAITFSIGSRADKGARHDGTARPVDPAVEPELAAAVSAKMNDKYNWSAGLIVEIRVNQTGETA
jgi:deazaflavin-dependent oxidoreductase (nitroreductase family)